MVNRIRLFTSPGSCLHCGVELDSSNWVMVTDPRLISEVIGRCNPCNKEGNG